MVQQVLQFVALEHRCRLSCTRTASLVGQEACYKVLFVEGIDNVIVHTNKLCSLCSLMASRSLRRGCHSADGVYRTAFSVPHNEHYPPNGRSVFMPICGERRFLFGVFNDASHFSLSSSCPAGPFIVDDSTDQCPQQLCIPRSTSLVHRPRYPPGQCESTGFDSALRSAANPPGQPNTLVEI